MFLGLAGLKPEAHRQLRHLTPHNCVTVSKCNAIDQALPVNLSHRITSSEQQDFKTQVECSKLHSSFSNNLLELFVRPQHL